MKFKVGDKVKIIKIREVSINDDVLMETLNNTGTIVEISSKENAIPYAVKFGESLFHTRYFEDELELIK